MDIKKVVQTTLERVKTYVDNNYNDVNNKVGELNSLNTSTKNDIVSAVNEVVELSNDAKASIADAVGEPLNPNDTFSNMSNDINNLLSTFKTNMMNNGITVESGDKFKQLIDKIATMVEEGEGKGIQFVRKDITLPKGSKWLQVDDLGFKANIVMYNIDTSHVLYDDTVGYDQLVLYPIGGSIGSAAYSSVSNFPGGMYINENGFRLPIFTAQYTESNTQTTVVKTTTIIAIGVGEEDTTLRDSLADILENKGVDVTEEDDMASLITKVDSISSGLDIISATELPATGRENQICVITENPVDNFIISNKYDELIQDVNIIGMYLSNTGIESDEEGTLYSLSSGNITTNYYFSKVCQGSSRLNSYYYSNNIWNKLTNGYIALVENGTVNNSTSGGFTANVTSRGLSLLGATNQATMSLTKNKINLSTYNTVKLTYYLESTYGLEGTFKIGAFNSTISDIYYFDYGAYKDETPYDHDSVDLNIPKTKTLDISGWNGDCYFGVSAVGLNIVITDIIFF